MKHVVINGKRYSAHDYHSRKSTALAHARELRHEGYSVHVMRNAMSGDEKWVIYIHRDSKMNRGYKTGLGKIIRAPILKFK